MLVVVVLDSRGRWRGEERNGCRIAIENERPIGYQIKQDIRLQ
jgi:hypothetical protein